MACCCIELLVNRRGVSPEVIAFQPLGEANGRCTYTAIINLGLGAGLEPVYLWYEQAPKGWIITRSLPTVIPTDVVFEDPTGYINDDCPNNGTLLPSTPALLEIFENVVLRDCTPNDCGPLCGTISFSDEQGNTETKTLDNINASGTLNGKPKYTMTIATPLTGLIRYWTLFYDIQTQKWTIEDAGLGNLLASTETGENCPFGLTYVDVLQNPKIFFTAEFNICEDSGPCIPVQERIFKEYQGINIPNNPPSIEHDEPFRCCDDKLLMLASLTETESYKNDITSAWIKLSSPSDSVVFKFTDEHDNATNYIPTPVAFPNEADAFYITIPWRDVLASDGEGCYKLVLEFSIGGITGNLNWGVYKLKQYSLKNAQKTARIRVKFNLKQSIEGIDFTNSNVEDSLRFFGFIGNRQPNMEIDNLIYSDRTVKTVVRENLNSYEIKTDPYTNTLLDLFSDLYLLSENELYISDYNYFNHSHSILDIPVIVLESPEIDYLEAYQRKAVLTCIVTDKNQNKRTFY